MGKSEVRLFVGGWICAGSKRHRKLFLSENSFPVVFRVGEHEYEYGRVTDHHQGGHVISLHSRGQKNIES